MLLRLAAACRPRNDGRAGKLSATRNDRFLKLHLIGEGSTSHYCMMRKGVDGKDVGVRNLSLQQISSG